jgi:PAS domain-containing protein
MAKKPTYEELKQRVKELEKESLKRKRIEEALQIERDNLRNIFESIEDGIYIVNQQYDIQYINPVFVKRFGPYEGIKCYRYFYDRDKAHRSSGKRPSPDRHGAS